MSNNSFYEKVENTLIGPYQFERHEHVLKDQIMLLKILIIISGFLITVMATLRLLDQNFIQASVDMIFVVILSSSYHFLHRDKHHFKAVSRVIIGFALFTIATLIHTLPYSFSPLIWVATTIYLMFFLLSKREAWKWLTIVMSYLAFIYFSGHGLKTLSPSDLFVFFGNVLLLSLVLTWYEKIKEENAEHYLQKNLRLKAEVAEKTKALRETNTSLNELNETLEERIDDEILKSRKKDKIMLSQSRQAAMGDMISMIAHQWRQPITVIGMATNNILLDLEFEEYDKQRTEEKLNIIIEQTEYLSHTIDDFRDFLRPTKRPKSAMLTSITEGALSIIGPSLEENGITLKNSPESDIELMTFPNELVQVLLNVLSNAKDALKNRQIEDGHIWLYTKADETTAIFKVCDDAGGIPDDVLPRIFEPYFSTKESKGGTGLGLYMSQLIIEKRLGGSIQGENSGDGACFTISLPRREKE